MNCPACGFDNPSGMGFCGKCGGSLSGRCPHCSFDNPAGFDFCGQCGASLRVSGLGSRVSSRTADTQHPTPDPRSYTPKHLADKVLQSKSALEGERKQVTVLFADVKGSMQLADQVDPEEWHRILDKFFQILTDGVHRFEGTVNQYPGDGIMALFGAPIAHEDHAQRACYAALHLLEEVRAYSREVKRAHGLDFAVRIGLHSGDVVVGKIGDDLRMDYTAQGHTVGLAQRMESLAEANTCLVSAATAAFASGYFALDDLGPFRVKGVAEPVHVFVLRGLGASRTRFDIARARGLSRFVGRAADLRTLDDALEQAAAGNGQVVGVVAEAGTGKSRLCFEFLERCRARGMRVYEGRAVAHGRNVPFLPILEVFRAYFGITLEDDDRSAREKIAGRMVLLDQRFAETLPLLFDFLAVRDPQRPAPRLDPEARQRQLLGVMRQVIQSVSEAQPTVTLIEDLHWLDAASAEFLEHMVDAREGSRNLLLVNFRPEYRAEWMQKSWYRQIPLTPLGREAIAELLADLLGKDPSLAGLATTVHARTGGNPFFTEEVAQSLIESGQLAGTRGAYRLVTPIERLEVPATVQAVLAARIDRLPAAEKEVLQLLAVIGKEFRFGLVQQVAEHGEEELRGLLAGLQAREFIYEQPAFPEPEYTFKHALTQEVAYGSVLAARRQVLHARTAQAIEDLFRCTLDVQYAELARHYSRTDNAAKAVEYLRLAGTQAAARGAYEEAVAQLSRGLERLPELPEVAEREHQELLLQLALGPALRTTKGSTAPEVEKAYGRAAEICTRLGEGPQRWQALYGLWLFYNSRADLQRARRLAEQLLQSVRPSGDAWHLFMGHNAVGITLYLQGELRAAREHLQQAFDLGGPLRQRLDTLPYEAVDGLLANRGWRANVLDRLGDPDQAVRASRENVALAQEIGRPFALTLALLFDGVVHQVLGEVEATRERADAVIALATEHGFYQHVVGGMLLRGCAFADGGQIETGITELRGVLDALRAAGAEAARPHYTGTLAEALGKAGQPAQGLAVIEEAVECMNRTGQHVSESDLQRIKGDLLLAVSRDTHAEAEDCFRHAIDCARVQSAKSLELRAALSLSRLWRAQGKHADARTLLAEIYGWFTEGFETRDLKEAKALLEELR